MTAGRSAGTEQGQGRECAVCLGYGIDCPPSGCQRPPSVPPARDSGRDEAREFPQSFSAPPRINEAREAVASIRARIAAAAAQAPTRGCCGATDSSDCHQMGLCLMDGRHPRAQRELAEAREAAVDAVALALAEYLVLNYIGGWDGMSAKTRRLFKTRAEHLLSLPAVAALLRDGTTT